MEEMTLARFVQEKREKMGLSQSGLAKKCHLELDLVEKIESGQELFLPSTKRQNLAKGLKCSLEEIKELEKSFDGEFVSPELIALLKDRILKGEKEMSCPKCSAPLIIRVAKLYDLEDNLVLHPKARCSKCVFQIKD